MLNKESTTPVEGKEPVTLDEFLQSIEVKAYHVALLAVGQHADALDLLQDSMLKLATHYANKPSDQWKPLFYQILQNKIKDWYRHQQVRKILYFWQSSHEQENNMELPDHAPLPQQLPEAALCKEQQQNDVLETLKTLPLRQHQCFLMRSWEGLSVAETAAAMGCSQGSVKTHYSRAISKLRSVLGESHDIQI